MSERSRELAADLARRAIAAAERRQHDAGIPEDVAERLRSAADEDGRLSFDEAVRAVTGAEAPTNSLNAEFQRERQERQRQSHERLFGPQPEPGPPPIKPQGSADGGAGEPGDAIYEETALGRMRVWSDAELRQPNPKETSE